jgi:hypothetical protein
MDFPEVPYVELDTQTLIRAQVYLDSVNDGHFT